MLKRTIAVFFLLLLNTQQGRALAQENHLPPLAPLASQTTNPWLTQLYIFGAGESLEEWWGHIGLYVKNSQTKEEHFYNWGGFSFDEQLVLGFATGRLRFWMSDEPLRPYLQFYRRNNRDIRVSTFNLSAGKAERLNSLAQVNLLPENREYDYEYFKNNCATRIRDLFDIILDGQLAQKYKSLFSDKTIRDHVHILASHSWPMDLILNFLLSGNVVDKPLSQWDEMFLPEELEKHFNNFTYFENSQPIKLVQEKRVAFASSIPSVPKAINYTFPSLIFAICYLGLTFLLKYTMERRATLPAPFSLRLFVATILFLSGFLLGIPATVLFMFNIASNHTYTYWNTNVIFGNPLCLFFIVYAILFLCKIKINKKFLNTFFAVYLILFGISIVTKFIPQIINENAVYLIIFISVILGNLLLIKSINALPEEKT